MVTIIVSKSKARFFLNCGRSNRDIFPAGTIIFYDFNAFYMQRLHCIFSIHAIRTAHSYFIIVTHTLHLSSTYIIMCLSDKRVIIHRHCHRYDFCLQMN